MVLLDIKPEIYFYQALDAYRTTAPIKQWQSHFIGNSPLIAQATIVGTASLNLENKKVTLKFYKDIKSFWAGTTLIHPIQEDINGSAYSSVALSQFSAGENSRLSAMPANLLSLFLAPAKLQFNVAEGVKAWIVIITPDIAAA